MLNYKKIDDKIIGYCNSQIFELNIKIDANKYELSLTELDNDGLEGKIITSVSKFDNKIYLTSFSGVYYKDYDDFFVKKEIKKD